MEINKPRKGHFLKLKKILNFPQTVPFYLQCQDSVGNVINFFALYDPRPTFAAVQH